MGSYTKIRGNLKPISGEITDEIYLAFLKEFGSPVERLRRKHDIPEISKYSIYGVSRKEDGSIQYNTEWKGCNILEDTKPWLEFFANRGIFFEGQLDCTHEYGDLFGLLIKGDTIIPLEGYVAYKKGKPIKLEKEVVTKVSYSFKQDAAAAGA